MHAVQGMTDVFGETLELPEEAITHHSHGTHDTHDLNSVVDLGTVEAPYCIYFKSYTAAAAAGANLSTRTTHYVYTGG
jgi:hypothetical protein